MFLIFSKVQKSLCSNLRNGSLHPIRPPKARQISDKTVGIHYGLQVYQYRTNENEIED
jgi:hypothetical protein